MSGNEAEHDGTGGALGSDLETRMAAASAELHSWNPSGDLQDAKIRGRSGAPDQDSNSVASRHRAQRRAAFAAAAAAALVAAISAPSLVRSDHERIDVAVDPIPTVQVEDSLICTATLEEGADVDAAMAELSASLGVRSLERMAPGVDFSSPLPVPQQHVQVLGVAITDTGDDPGVWHASVDRLLSAVLDPWTCTVYSTPPLQRGLASHERADLTPFRLEDGIVGCVQPRVRHHRFGLSPADYEALSAPGVRAFSTAVSTVNREVTQVFLLVESHLSATAEEFLATTGVCD
ncbi:MAG: hypothetical protein GX868_08890 [Actinobacteria bacterium]|nr:hypothetical protein [Actinomycetota bacterium]